VVPVAIKNSDLLMGKGTGEARSGTIEMVIMPPVGTSQLEDDKDIAALIHDIRQSIVRELQVTTA